MFEVGQKVKVIEPEKMGITDFDWSSGPVHVVVEIDEEDGAALFEAGYGILPEWIEDGYAEIVEE